MGSSTTTPGPSTGADRAGAHAGILLRVHGDDKARYRRCRYRTDTLDELCRKGRAELDRKAGRLRARGVVAGARLLEIGSYGGAFLELAHQAGCRATGIDINPDVVAHCRARGFDVRCEASSRVASRPASSTGSGS